ncbi:MAG: hypothetical protein HY903_10255 [Deltaproteobacteria bacterium]|nr:hypothetical protein [Deltaproteobacteria bacterium]
MKEMKEIKAIVQPFKLADVVDALQPIVGVDCVTVFNVEGFGREAGSAGVEVAASGSLHHISRRMVVTVVRDDVVDQVLEAIQKRAHTGNLGDGIAYVTNVEEAVRLRTGERGEESQRAVDLLQNMRSRRIPFAIIVDEQGGMSGIVTIEDLLEELVGEMFSEHAEQVPQLVRRQPDGSAIVSGVAPIREVNRELDIELPDEGDWTTVAGLCLALAGHIPSQGETIKLPNGLVLEVVDASPRRVRAVRIRTGHDVPGIEPPDART